jgi:flagellar FliJ protein
MPRFVFQFDAVLRHRKTLEEQRQRELALAQREMTKLEAQLREIDDTTRGVSTDVRDNRLTGTLDMSFLAAHRRYVLAMQRKAIVIAQKMAQQQQVVDAARRALTEAAKQRKIMEKLKERQHERWKSEESRRQLEELDEVRMRLALEPYFAAASETGAGGGGDEL